MSAAHDAPLTWPVTRALGLLDVRTERHPNGFDSHRISTGQHDAVADTCWNLANAACD